MNKRNILIFCLAGLAIIVAIVVIYFCQVWIRGWEKKALPPFTACENISSEDQCSRQESCEGIYGASCPDCHDLMFKNCQTVPASILSLNEKEKNICQKTGGEWYRNKLGSFCLCQQTGLNRVFDKNKGCVSK